MSKRKYNKPALSIEKQLQFLSNQGLIIDNREKASQVLAVVNYYRLSGYLLPFKQNHSNNCPRNFKKNTTFNQIWQLYQFDRELRLLTIDAIEKIEIAFRTGIINVTGIRLNPFWYIDRNFYKQTEPYNVLIKNIKQIAQDKHEIFIKHYFDNYQEPPYPPIWMLAETLSFGACSKMLKNIKSINIRQEICSVFKQHPTIIESWLQVLTYTRNICAHHCRLWNRWFVYAPIIPKKEKQKTLLEKNNRKFIASAYIIHQLLKEIAPKSHWREKLFDLFQQYENSVPFQAMGFQKDWKNNPLWKI